MEPTNKEILTAFLEIVVEDLSEWVVDANNIISKIYNKLNTVAEVFKIAGYQLRYINTSITTIKNRINDLFVGYKNLEEKYEMKPLTVAYYMEFEDHAKSFIEIVNQIKLVAEKYDHILEKSKNDPEIEIDQYVTPINQKSIEVLKKLDENSLLKMLEKGHLVGM